MPRIMRWLALVVLTLPIHLVVVLAFTGVPKPPMITAEGVGRVGWQPVLDDASKIWRSRESKSVVTWMPDGSGMLVQGRRMILESRLHTLAEPGGEPVLLPQIPRNVAGIHSGLGREYMVLGWDTDGDEQHRLYRWDLGDTEPVLLTSEAERAMFGAFEPDGQRFVYATTRRNGKDVDIYVMDAFDPKSDRLLLEGEGAWSIHGWSRSTNELLLLHRVTNRRNEIYVLDVATTSLRQVTDHGEQLVTHGALQWSRDGTALYYASNRGTEFSHLRRLDLATGEETILSEEIPWDVMSIQQTGGGKEPVTSGRGAA
jgi:dipeptidyl aminopeptidase/acylaminoacyl peptidase